MSEPDATERWLRKAEDDLRAARLLISSDPPMADRAPLHAQQAAGKGLKAVLVHAGREPERTRDLTRVARPVLGLMPVLGPLVQPLLPLTEWAVVPRYPDLGDQDLPEPSQVRAVLPEMEAFLAAARRLLSRPKASPGTDHR